MATENYAELREFIEKTYHHIAKRPGIFSGRVEAIEPFILAMEFILDHFSSKTRNGRYSEFKETDQYGNEPFTRYFERTHKCRLGYISEGESPGVLPTEIFAKLFEEHWHRYLASIGISEDSENDDLPVS